MLCLMGDAEGGDITAKNEEIPRIEISDTKHYYYLRQATSREGDFKRWRHASWLALRLKGKKKKRKDRFVHAKT